jgi:hypothetical protein
LGGSHCGVLPLIRKPIRAMLRNADAATQSNQENHASETRMQRRTFLTGGLIVGLASTVRGASRTKAFAATAPRDAAPAGTPVTAAAPVVLELFTSQGCSSCPPADALLGQLAGQTGIIALAWHVDYWNGLGWHDPFSSRLATQRQQRYAAQLRDEVYTPALVVNGARMVVGSDGAAVRAAIGATGGLAVPVMLRRDGAAVSAAIGAAGQNVTALLATYDPQLATAVGAGENGGRRLIEYRVVRDVIPLGGWDGAPRRIALPAIAAGRGAVLLLQTEDLAVRGAADLPAV